MDFLQAVSLALIQGITEFLPISSSAHLILPTAVLGWPDQGLAFDTAVHFGSLLAVIWYFRLDISRLCAALSQSVTSGQHSKDSRFAINLIIASLPILPVGFLFRFDIEQHLRSVDVIIVTTIVFAILLLLADQLGRKRLTDTDINWKQALLIGLSQCLALVPGTSRSGITMTTALLAGFTREDASRISFLISIPAIAGASGLKLIDLASSAARVDWNFFLLGSAVAMISAYLCIKLFLDVIARIGFLPFVIYRIALGGLLLALFAI
ncbi:MAG: undecaprenyl-diphosphate phosphatase [Gammaproteobacteria bacterium]|nr:undecaprenyl-diphosphate phosphatase [Gammaproteobacteria bacterium]